MTFEQVEKILANEIGQWESKGHHKPADGAAREVHYKIETRWKEKGISTQFRQEHSQPQKHEARAIP